MNERKKVLVVAPNPYIVTNIINELDWRVIADFEKAYNLKDAQNICNEKKPAVVIIDLAVLGEEKLDVPKMFSKHKLVLLTSLQSFADLKSDMANVLEVFEKPYDNVAIANSLKKVLLEK